MLKKTSPCYRSGLHGSALVIVMGISAVLLLAGIIMSAMGRQAVARSQRINTGARALAVAEAGIADMIALLSTNYIMWRNTNHAAQFSDGIYAVKSQTLSNGNVLLVSTGTVGAVSRSTTIELLGTYQDWNDSLFSLDGVILSGGDVRLSTAAYEINGNVHANGSVLASGGAKNGDFISNAVVTAAGTVADLNNVPAANRIPGEPTRVLPTFNFDSYRQLAISNGLYYNNSMTFSGWHGRPSNGVVYVNGNVEIANNSSLVGTLVANGNILVRNKFTQTIFGNHTNWPSLLSTGNITLQNKESYNGIIYAALNVSIQNNITCNGGIISGGYIEIQNHGTMNQHTGYPPWDPLNPSLPPEVIVGGWLR
ncbi:MAG: hypothetical protein ACOYCD_02765 [Kiritimatiellia bacterium]